MEHVTDNKQITIQYKYKIENSIYPLVQSYIICTSAIFQKLSQYHGTLIHNIWYHKLEPTYIHVHMYWWCTVPLWPKYLAWLVFTQTSRCLSHLQLDSQNGWMFKPSNQLATQLRCASTAARSISSWQAPTGLSLQRQSASAGAIISKCASHHWEASMCAFTLFTWLA